MSEILLEKMRSHQKLSAREQILLVILLSIPAVLAQISTIVMQYIDTSMVGSLGAGASASIGLVSSSTWLCGGLCTASVTGFTILCAQDWGAGRVQEARKRILSGLLCAVGFSLLIALAAGSLSGFLPGWLSGERDLWKDASAYFLIFACFLPFQQLNSISGSLLQASGNMKIPGLLHVLMCGLDVMFNAVLIYDNLMIGTIRIPGLGLGVAGAALGTGLSQLTVSLVQTGILLKETGTLQIVREHQKFLEKKQILAALKLGIPAGAEQVLANSSYIAFTAIVAPLGTTAIAANSFAITAESLCYMPAYGISAAAVTMIGQCVGAGQNSLAVQISRRIVWFAMLLMCVSAGILWLTCPWLISFLSPVQEVRDLAVQVLRMEVLAEAMYGASIAATGILRGYSDTLWPALLSLISMWGIRIPLAWLLSGPCGLPGVWAAMVIELNCRGILFLMRLHIRQKQMKFSTQCAKIEAIY